MHRSSGAARALLEAGDDTEGESIQHDNDVKVVTWTGATFVRASVTGTAKGATKAGQERVREVIRFIAETGAPLGGSNNQDRTPMDVTDIAPMDKFIELSKQLIATSGVQPRHPSAR